MKASAFSTDEVSFSCYNNFIYVKTYCYKFQKTSIFSLSFSCPSHVGAECRHNVAKSLKPFPTLLHSHKLPNIIKFLHTVYYGGFSSQSKDLNLVCTMHANCCAGLDSKIQDLRILLDEWRNYSSLLKD
ncbi:nucleotide-diphospho-sugar transferase family protein, partial [Striga asiatica]